MGGREGEKVREGRKEGEREGVVGIERDTFQIEQRKNLSLMLAYQA